MKRFTQFAAVFVFGLFQFMGQAYAAGCPCFDSNDLARTTQFVSPEEISTCADIELEVGPRERLISNVIRVTKDGLTGERQLLSVFTTQLLGDKVYHYHCTYNPLLADTDDPDKLLEALENGTYEAHVISLKEAKACRKIFRRYYQRVQNIECPGF